MTRLCDETDIWTVMTLSNYIPVVMGGRLDERLEVPAIVQLPGSRGGLVAKVPTPPVVEEVLPSLVPPPPEPHTGGAVQLGHLLVHHNLSLCQSMTSMDRTFL